MTKSFTYFLLLCSCFLWAQEGTTIDSYSHFIIPEFLIGKTVPANTNFPETNAQTGYLFSFGKFQDTNKQEWAYRLNYPRTGITFGVNNLGNPEKVGYVFSALPFVEFDMFRKRKKDLHLQIGMGASYFNKRYDSITNPLNQGVTTNITWSFRMFFYYDILQKQKTSWRLGAGYYHHSNGHTRLPNQGFNSFLVSASSRIGYNKKSSYPSDDEFRKTEFSKSSNYYLDFRSGIGSSVLSEDINDRREVYSAAISVGTVINRTYKFGLGFYYRFYEHYYDYIKAEEGLIPEMYPQYPDQPFYNATNFGVFGAAELLLNHVGIEINIGYSFYKPGYDFDWQLNEGYTYTEDFGDGPIMFTILGDLESSKFKLKKRISSRLGLKYYLIGTDKNPNHNVYLGAHINGNLGQADFSELSLGYVYSFKFKSSQQ